MRSPGAGAGRAPGARFFSGGRWTDQGHRYHPLGEHLIALSYLDCRVMRRLVRLAHLYHEAIGPRRSP
ncbi:MAG TPA: hypothetical protein VNO22_02485, partial [Planctomycetota bacterium]|nr:hypothetical protein [Planctomycetota bacterium]